MMRLNDALSAVGNTPLIRLQGFEPDQVRRSG
jgi:hypothetical protein